MRKPGLTGRLWAIGNLASKHHLTARLFHLSNQALENTAFTRSNGSDERAKTPSLDLKSKTADLERLEPLIRLLLLRFGHLFLASLTAFLFSSTIVPATATLGLLIDNRLGRRPLERRVADGDPELRRDVDVLRFVKNLCVEDNCEPLKGV